MSLSLVPITFKEACAFIEKYHRHHKPPQGWKFGTAVSDGEKVVGVVMIGRPPNTSLDNGITLEVIRCCTDGTPHVASMLYATARRAAKALGYRRLITYILETETGTSLKAAGWVEVHHTKYKPWNHPSRPRVDKAPVINKIMWEAVL